MTTNDQNPGRPDDGTRPDDARPDDAADGSAGPTADSTHRDPSSTPTAEARPTAATTPLPGYEQPGYEQPGYEQPSYGQPAPGYSTTPGQQPDAATATYPQQGQAPGYVGWPTPPARAPRNRKKTLVIAGIAVGALVLLGGAFGGGVAVGTAIDQPGPGQFSERVMPDGGPGGNGEMPQLPDGGLPGDDGSSGDSGTTDGSSS